jgi:hypothetical protein
MNRAITICAAAVFSCAAAATAQTQQTGQTQQTQTQQKETTTASPQGRATTSMFIGCVDKGSTPNAFVLSVVEVPKTATAGPAPAGPGQGPQATGTTGVMVGHKVELIGGTNMASHVGHKVEVSGMIVPQGNATGRPGQAPAANTRVNVTNVRMIETTCTAPAATPATAGTSGATTSEPSPAPETQKAQPDPQGGAPGQRQY